MKPWEAWYGLEGDAAEEAGISALMWIDDRSESETGLSEISVLLESADASQLPTPVILDILSDTLCLVAELPARNPFRQACQQVLCSRLGAAHAELLLLYR